MHKGKRKGGRRKSSKVDQGRGGDRSQGSLVIHHPKRTHGTHNLPLLGERAHSARAQTVMHTQECACTIMYICINLGYQTLRNQSRATLRWAACIRCSL